MKRTGFLLVVAALAPSLAPAASREIIELQRDVAQLQEQVTTLQRAFDEKMGQMQLLVQQTLDVSTKSSNALADAGRNQEAFTQRVISPVAGLNSKVETMGNDVAALRESVNDLTARMNKIQQQLVDLNNIMRAAQTPVVAPPPATGGGAPLTGTDAGAPDTAASQGVPPVKATTLYENALRDMQSGKADLALGEFQDYLKFYGTTDLAPNAQYYVGSILYTQGQFDQAIQEFDKVLEQYPNNNKTADAHYMKGKILFQLGQRNAAAKEFLAVVNEFPNSDVAAQARAQLRVLGVNPSTNQHKRR